MDDKPEKMERKKVTHRGAAKMKQEVNERIKETLAKLDGPAADIHVDAEVPAELLPNLYNWPPANIATPEMEFNRELYHDPIEQAQFEKFIQPLWQVYSGKMADMRYFKTIFWGEHIKTNTLGQTKEWFRLEDGRLPKVINLGQFEITLILVNVITQQSLYCPTAKIARKVGCHIATVRRFQRKLRKIYGDMFPDAVKTYVEQYYNQCQAMIGVFMPLALLNKDPIAAKITGEYMDRQYRAVMEHSSKENVADYEDKLLETRKRIEELMKIEQKEPDNV